MNNEFRRQACRPEHKLNPVTAAVRSCTRSRQAGMIAAAVATGTICVGQQAIAQDLVLEEITVTASKRAENLQDVPISIVALDSQTLSDQGITSFED